MPHNYLSFKQRSQHVSSLTIAAGSLEARRQGLSEAVALPDDDQLAPEGVENAYRSALTFDLFANGAADRHDFSRMTW